MDELKKKRIRFLAYILDQHDLAGTTPPAELEMEWRRLNRWYRDHHRAQRLAIIEDPYLAQMGAH